MTAVAWAHGIPVECHRRQVHFLSSNSSAVRNAFLQREDFNNGIGAAKKGVAPFSPCREVLNLFGGMGDNNLIHATFTIYTTSLTDEECVQTFRGWVFSCF